MSTLSTPVLEKSTSSDTAFVRRFAVVLLNDDFTPMDFVVHILSSIFHLSEEKAVDVMMQVHQEGKGVAGVFTHEIAETKVDQAHRLSVHHGHPFRCEVHPAE